MGMKYRVVRVSEWSYQELKRRAEASKRTVVAEVDLAVGGVPVGAQKNSRVPPAQTVDPLHGIPAVIGTSEDFPLTTRPGEYMGIERSSVPAPKEAPPCKCGHFRFQHKPRCLQCECKEYSAAKELF